MLEQLQKIKNKNYSYKKEHKTFEKQLELLIEKGLTVSDKKYALSKLKHINYYRLSAYFLPFQYKKDDLENEMKFLPKTTFEDIIQLYTFDSELRKIIFGAIENIEIYFRTQIAYHHSSSFEAFGYLNIDNLRNNFKEQFDELQQNIQKEKDRSKEVFIKHFKKKYNSGDLPVWSVVEIISFGSLSKFFMLLKEEEQNKAIKEIDGINKYVFVKWLKALSSVRNACAHHSRLWNKTLGISFEVPKDNTYFQDMAKSKNKIFFALSVIKFILISIGDGEECYENKIRELLNRYQHVDLNAMGFPNNWKKFELWKNR
ncbi:MAG: Abi family protein [Sulfurospirillum sp.]|nr:Abi family protein [Sulfurospirillum sp.]MBL0703454.1 Abi family protein [Sulfurospirillum sp.]